MDHLRVGTSSANATGSTNFPPFIIGPPASLTVQEGATAGFTVTATGDPPLSYRWRFGVTNTAAATNDTLILTNVTTAEAGVYAVTVTQSRRLDGQPARHTDRDSAAAFIVRGVFALLTYNTHGYGVTNWSTNSSHVQAIGRQLQFLQPDIITFQEIPFTNTYQMPDFVAAFLPGYFLATNSATDGEIRSVIASRFPIVRSQSWLHDSDLSPYGYTNSDFTRDLFEAQIQPAGFEEPLHVFTVHLKSSQDADSAAKRAAEAGAVSNFFAAVFPATNSGHPCVLTGDLNEDINFPPAGNPQTSQRLTGGPTGLQLTTPVNPFTGSELTYSIRNAEGLTRRYDYILPCGLLFSNTVGSQVFRTDLLTNPPPPLLAGDDATASDHLPVVMVFGNPYDTAFRLLSLRRDGPLVTLTWESISDRQYTVEKSANLASWSPLAADCWWPPAQIAHLSAPTWRRTGRSSAIHRIR